MALLDDIAARLDAAAVTGGATGWLAVKSYFPPSPDKVVYIQETGSTAAPDIDFFYSSFQLIVRGDAQDPEPTNAKALAALNALDNQTVSNYIFVFAQNSIIDIGRDKNDRPEFSLNFKTMIPRA